MGLDIEIGFDELGLPMDGLDVGMFSGTATIRICSDGEWLATGIKLDGYRKSTDGEQHLGCGPWIKGTVTLAQSDPLFRMIANQLETGSYRDHVESRVIACLEEEGAAFLSARGRVAAQIADARA